MRPLLLLILLLALITLVWANGWRPPDRYNPWAPLDLRAAPDMFLRYKLHRLGNDPAMCRAAIRDGGAVFSPVPDHEEASGCGWEDAVRVTAIGEVRLSSPVMLTCPLTASMLLFERQVLQPQAEAAFGASVGVIEHVGSYACRNIYHRDQAPLSRHARADAIDLTAFRFADGRRVSVERDWRTMREGTFLRAVQTEGCPYFGALFGPGYNAAHRTHFHAQGGGFGYCR